MSPPPVPVTIALGSNLGDRRGHLAGALRRLRELARAGRLRVSSFHETEPVGGPQGQPTFLNAVCQLETRLTPRALLERMQAIEAQAGRERRREVRNGPRTLDLDLLLYGGRTIDEPDLRVPHPRMEQRAFVLAPLAEIDPRAVLPSGRSAAEALADLHARGPSPLVQART